jgi:hypothetical protein
MRRAATIVAISILAVSALGSPAGAGGRPLDATLTGSTEVPGPGDPDGSGSAFVTVNHGRGEVCWWISVQDITLPALAAHIHTGPAGVAGGIVVTLSPPDVTGAATGCTSVDRALAKDILKNGEQYYVNVHTSDYPAGALRGQLG